LYEFVAHFISDFLILMSCTVIIRMFRNVSPVTLPCCSYRRRKYTELSENWSSEKSYLLSDNVERVSEATWQYTTAHAGYWRLLTHAHNMQYLLLFHGHSGYTNAPVITYIACLRCLAVSVAETHPGSWSPKQPHSWRVSSACFTVKQVIHQRGMCQLYKLLLASSVMWWRVALPKSDTPCTRVPLKLFIVLYPFLIPKLGKFPWIDRPSSSDFWNLAASLFPVFLFIWSFCSNECC